MPEMLAEATLTIHSVSLHVVAVLTCACGRGPIVITGTSDLATCPSCAARYMVSSIRHQPKADGTFDTEVQVGRLSDLAIPRGNAVPFKQRN
jgi:hypothetical protein